MKWASCFSPTEALVPQLLENPRAHAVCQVRPPGGVRGSVISPTNTAGDLPIKVLGQRLVEVIGGVRVGALRQPVKRGAVLLGVVRFAS